MRIRRHACAVLLLTLAGIACSPANTGGGNQGPSVHTLTLKVQGGGRIQGTGIPDCQTSCSAALPSVSSITLTAAADSGSGFSAWSGDCSGTGACAVKLDADRTVTATFSALPPPPSGKHWLTVSLKGSGSVTSSPAGIDCGSTCLASFDEGGNVTLTATPASGFHFGGFGGACTGASCTVTMSADASVLAWFEADSAPPPPVAHDLTVTRSGEGTGTVTSSPGGIDCGGTCRASFADGMDVTLSATAASGSTFQGWQGACSGADATCKVHMSGDVQATAVFQLVAAPDECAGFAPPPLPPAVTVSTGFADYRGCGGGTSDGAGHVALPLPASEGDGSAAAQIVIVDATGQKTGEANFTGYLVPPLLEQEDGFEGSLARYHRGNVGIFALRSDGSVTSADAPGMVARHALDPLGGAAVANFPYGAGPPPNSWLQSYDAHAALRWRISLDRKAGSTAFVDRTGNILLLSTADDGSNIGEWVDHDGHKGFDFRLTGLSAWYGYYEGAPRVGSGVFLQKTSPHEPYEWSAQLDSGATTWTPPPPWLTQRPDTKIHMAFGGRAYAMIDRPKASTSCTQQIEVLAPSGKSCGKVSFPIRDGTCDTQSLDVGYDGTVVQLQPFDSFPKDSNGRLLCTWRFWPRVFASR